VKLIFIKGNQEAQQFIPLMGNAILYALGDSIEKNNLVYTVMHTTTSPKGVEFIIDN
jgi:hypothetical protein